MDQKYYDALDNFEKSGISREYIDGWVGGYLHNPKREEQRITDGYSAGFDDGSNGSTDHMSDWKS